MWYNKKKIPVLEAKNWYNKLAKEYKKYHNDLDSWDDGLFKKFIPRDLNNLSVLDIWGWDWRMTKFFVWRWLKDYTICDISEEILDRCKWWVNKVVCNLEEELMFEDNSFDIILCFFVLLHISDIETLFQRLCNKMKVWWKFIVLHHIERNSMIYDIKKEKFKIKTYTHRYEYIEKIAEKYFCNISYIDLIEKNQKIAKLYCFEKI